MDAGNLLLERDNNNYRSRKRLKTIFGVSAKHLCVLIFIIITLAPFIWTLSTSFKSSAEILAYPPRLLPLELTFKNYVDVLSASNYPRYILNSTIVTVFSVVLTVVASLFAGYGAARYEFPGKELIMFLILAGMAIGRFANVIPLYFLSTKLHLFDTYLILIISSAAFIIPLITWLMQAYFKTIPKELEEAAKIDGCNNWTAFVRVIVPVMQPAIVAAIVISMANAWNEFILALTLTRSPEMRTVSVALNYFLTEYGVNWGSLSAAAVISMLPILIVFFLLQKYFIKGLTAGTLGSS
jgi:multiple sugar transport system permease protein